MNAPAIRLDLLRPRLRVVEAVPSKSETPKLSLGGISTQGGQTSMPKKPSAPKDDNKPRNGLALALPETQPEHPQAVKARELAKALTVWADTLDGKVDLESFPMFQGRNEQVKADIAASVEGMWRLYLGQKDRDQKEHDHAVRMAIDDACRAVVKIYKLDTLPDASKALPGAVQWVLGRLETLLGPAEVELAKANAKAIETLIGAVIPGRSKPRGTVTIEQATEALFLAMNIPCTFDTFKRARDRSKARKQPKHR
jgi:hypothetical protein